MPATGISNDAQKSSAVNDFAHEAGLSAAAVSDRYNQWARAGKYDVDLGEANFRGPALTAGAVAELFPDHAARAQVRLVDFAAGTGFAGEKLNAEGFVNIDAMEPAEDMAKVAGAKGVYKSITIDYLDGHRTELGDDTYDCAVICGGMGEGHIPVAGMPEFARVVKPGGYCVIVMRENYLKSVAEYKGRLEPKFEQMAEKGVWKAVSRTVVPRYSFDNNGVIYVFEITSTAKQAEAAL